MHPTHPRTLFEKLAGWFMPQAKAEPFRLEQRIDLVPTTAPSYGSGRYVVFDYLVPKGQCFIVKGIAGCCWQRTNIGGVNATFQRMSNVDVAGKVLFTPIVNNRVRPFSQNTLNSPTTLAGAANTPVSSAGFTTITEDPDTDLGAMWFNPLFSFPVRSGERLQVLFEILPVTSGTTLQVTSNPAVTARVDFAGAIAVGQIVDDALYSDLLQR